MNKVERFHFPHGIPGFEEYADFQLTVDDEAPLAQLVSVQNQHVGFVLAKPEYFFSTYIEDLQTEINKMELKASWDFEKDSIAVWVIVTINRNDVSKSTANLRAPILLNEDRGEGIQLILDSEVFFSRQPLFETLNLGEQEGGTRNAGVITENK